jgi:hypothetical protein
VGADGIDTFPNGNLIINLGQRASNGQMIASRRRWRSRRSL